MYIELTEVMLCPSCRPRQGLVAVVDEMRGRRIVAGYLGCPACETRHPIRAGEVYLRSGVEGDSGDEAVRAAGGRGEGPAAAARRDESSPGDGSPTAGAPVDGGPEGRLAVTVAALLGLQDGAAGRLLLGPGLEAAAGVLELSEGIEALLLTSKSGPPRDRLTRVHGARLDRLPIVPGRLRGVVLRGGTKEETAEAVRTLSPGGRLVVLSPAPGVTEAVGGLPVRVLAAEEAALVAIRR